MTLYDKILADPIFEAEYKKYDDTFLLTDIANHGKEHALNVVRNCEMITKLLRLSQNEIVAIKIAALLHDIGCAQVSKQGNEDNRHAERSYIWAKGYFSDKRIDDESLQKILEAIRYHDRAPATGYGKIVCCADKLDVNTARVNKCGLSVPGHRQYANIKDVKLSIVDKIFVVRFISDGKINFSELNEYGFTPKIHKAIKDFAEHYKLGHKIYMDATEWKI